MNYISLGYFCAIAGELERFGLHDRTYPFDWLISDFEGVIRAIETHFEDFWEYKEWYQDKNNRHYYKHNSYDFHFHHDFDSFQSLEKQLPAVREKYNRRIEAFYSAIEKPTLFIRYISDEQRIEGISKELLWIEENNDRIISLLKSFNSDNEIMYIANSEVKSDKITIYPVTKEKGKLAVRFPFDNNKELNKYFSSVDHHLKAANLKWLEKKSKRRKKLKTLMRLIKRMLVKEYHHDRVFKYLG